MILQADQDNLDTSYVLVLVCPLSSKVSFKDERNYLLSKGQAGLPKDSLAELGHIQPMLKRDLFGAPIGKLDAVSMSEIDSILAANLGLISRPS